MKAFTDIKEKAHQIAWETSKDYDPLLSKEAWCEMAALDMASWLEKQGEPEDEENKDERIRKGIIRNLQYLMDRSEGFVKEDLQERIAWLEKQNSAWSEKDKNLLNRLIGVLDGTNEEDYHEAWEDKFLPWLKSLKQRIGG